jgi:hypothetical protein
MATSFTNEERVMFDNTVEGFDDLLVIGKAATKYSPPDGKDMVHYGDRFWLDTPFIGASYDGFDQTANFDGLTDLAVPVTIGFHKSIPKTLSAKNLRETYAMDQYGLAAKQKLASDINLALFNTVALQGSVVVKRTVAPTGFDDIAQADAAMTEIGVPAGNRAFFAAPRVYNAMASNLASRNEATARSNDAYGKALINSDIAGFQTFKNDQSINLAAAAGGATTVNGANQFLEPKAKSTAATGEVSNVDNRYSTLVVTSANYAGIKAGDAFTLTGVNSVHLITKADTGQLQTFRVIGKPAANTLLIAPAIISNQGATIGGKEYQNVTATPATGATLTWLNTVTAPMNPFFVKSQLLIVPGSYAVDSGDGWSVMRATTELGIALTYVRQGSINDLSVKVRWDVDFGTSLLNPAMAGVELFSQT